MKCNLDRERLELFLEGKLGGDEAAVVQAHVERCATCQAAPIVDAALARFLREKLQSAPVSAAFRDRVRAAVHADSPAAPIVAPRPAWLDQLLGSSWMPRLAMAAVLAFLILVPLRSLFRAPALASVAVERHKCHAEAIGDSIPPCCKDLMLAVGDSLVAPALGGVVPDLGSDGLELELSTLCSFKDIAVSLLGYRAPDSSLFSLYISDRVTGEFDGLRTRETGGLLQARHRVKDNDVTIWKRDGLVYFWVGPHANPSYDLALADLQRKR